MDMIVSLLQSLVPFLIVLSILVYIHEMGHYIVARLNGVRVEIFSIGFGPELFGWTNKNNTRWKVSLIPLGGYVKIANEEDVFSDAERQKLEKKMPEDSLLAKPIWARIAVSFAGPAANYVLALVLLSALYVSVGQRVLEPGVLVGQVMPESPALKAGLAAGDKILSVNGKELESVEDFQGIVSKASGQTLKLEVITPDNAPKQISLTPQKDGQGYGKIGIALRGVVVSKKHDFFASIYYAGKDVLDMSVKTVLMLGDMIVGNRSADGLSGPIGIASLVGDVAKQGLVEILFLSAFLSINLGLINLFPIPILDGGHILLYIMEWIRGKPVPEKVQNFAFNIGFGLMAALFIFTFWNDLMRLQWVHKLINLVTNLI